MYQTIAEKFDHLGVDNAPGQESQQNRQRLNSKAQGAAGGQKN